MGRQVPVMAYTCKPLYAIKRQGHSMEGHHHLTEVCSTVNQMVFRKPQVKSKRQISTTRGTALDSGAILLRNTIIHRHSTSSMLFSPGAQNTFVWLGSTSMHKPNGYIASSPGLLPN